MAVAYVLIEVMPQENVQTVVGSLRKIEGVKAANAVAGPYDIIAELEGKDFNTIANNVIQNIRIIKGIGDTITLYVIV